MPSTATTHHPRQPGWLSPLLWLLALAALLGVARPAQAATTVTAVAAGDSHTCAIISGGAVQCWGANFYGQLGSGSGSTTSSATPVTVPGLAGATALAAGSNHTCAIVSGGAVQCWGFNRDGQLVNGSTTFSATPVTVPGLAGATALAAGGFHTCALISGGAVQCWGDNLFGQLGNGSTTDSAAPVRVQGLDGATALAAGSNHTCAIVSGGALQCWGLNFSGQLGNGSRTDSSTPVTVPGLAGATALAAGFDHTCAMISGGVVQCWGRNDESQLGNSSRTDSATPVTVPGLAGATALAAGFAHTCAIVSGGAVQCWGDNFSGQLGNGNTTSSATPVTVRGLAGATALAAGFAHTCTLISGGAVQCWGNNSSGQLGNGSTTSFDDPNPSPVIVSDLTGATALAAGGEHTCAIVSRGAVRCWGRNEDGQLGNGSRTESVVTPVTVLGLAGATALVAGFGHTCALVSGGTVKCWGYNDDGQLGNGSTTRSAIPVTVSGLTGATALATGSDHTCALISGGAVQCWGRNDDGQLGNGSRTDSATSVRVTGLAGATALAAGSSHTCALISGGAVQCWGRNSFGQLGNGSRTDSANPVRVPGLVGATVLVAGFGHTCAVVSGGAVQCWGYNDDGQLGNGSTSYSATPVTVQGLAGATALAAGRHHTCALISVGAVQCWGYNSSGQLGNGSTKGLNDPNPNPVIVSDLAGATALAAGFGHTCALISGGEGQCWGSNRQGQLGFVTTSTFPLPYRVPFAKPISISISSPVRLGGGSATALILNASFADGTRFPVPATQWRVSNAAAASISTNGLLTTKPVLADTPVQVRAVYNYAHVGKSSTATVTISPVSPDCKTHCTALVAQSGSATGSRIDLQIGQPFKLVLNLRRFASEPVDIYIALDLPGVPTPFWVGQTGVIFAENTFSASKLPFASARPTAWPDSDNAVLSFPVFPHGLPKGDYTFRAYAVTQGSDPFDTTARRGEVATAVLTIR